MERRRASLLSGSAVGVVLVVGALLWFGAGDAGDPGALPIPGEAIPLEVDVLNGTNIDALARRVTRRLRARGIDVVYYGSFRDSVVRATQILVRRGDSAAGVLVRDALAGIGQLVWQPDERRLVDITVLLGPDALPAVSLNP